MYPAMQKWYSIMRCHKYWWCHIHSRIAVMHKQQGNMLHPEQASDKYWSDDSWYWRKISWMLWKEKRCCMRTAKVCMADAGSATHYAITAMQILTILNAKRRMTYNNIAISFQPPNVWHADAISTHARHCPLMEMHHEPKSKQLFCTADNSQFCCAK